MLKVTKTDLKVRTTRFNVLYILFAIFLMVEFIFVESKLEILSTWYINRPYFKILKC
jgi:hypothetical protein